jgi:alkylation response protein AidB-like acyl-CoA dehydrogenase
MNEANKFYHKLGMRTPDTAGLSFRAVGVPEENLIEEEGKGFY